MRVPRATATREPVDNSEVSAAKGGIRHPKPWRIGEIKEFTPHFQLHSFPDGKLLKDAQIRIVERRATGIREKTRRIARDLVAGISKTG